MKLAMNGESYDVPQPYLEKLMADVLSEGAKDYQGKLDRKLQALAIGGARVILLGIEKHVTKKVEHEALARGMESKEAKRLAAEAASAIRPGKADPVLHLGFVFSRVVLEGLKHVALHIDTDGQGSVSAFGLVIEGAGEAGRLVGLDRGEGIREINGAQIP